MRRLFWPALTTGVMLAITLSLGTWQLQRLAWKQGLLAEIERGEGAPAEVLGAVPRDFARVTVTGRYRPEIARYGAEVRSLRAGAEMGARVLSLMDVPGRAPLVVDRGWAPIGFVPPPPSGPVTVEGYIRPAEAPVRFGAADDPAAKRFFALDPKAIGAALGAAEVSPYTLVLLGPRGTVPEPAQALPRPPNDHLSYAITWFGLSVVLIGVFAVYARQGRAPSRTA